MEGNLHPAESDEMVIALKPVQLVVMLGVLVAMVLLWRGSKARREG